LKGVSLDTADIQHDASRVFYFHHPTREEFQIAIIRLMQLMITSSFTKPINALISNNNDDFFNALISSSSANVFARSESYLGFISYAKPAHERQLAETRGIKIAGT